jgi:hypothetical protein
MFRPYLTIISAKRERQRKFGSGALYKGVMDNTLRAWMQALDF